jgi:hypothetical protein
VKPIFILIICISILIVSCATGQSTHAPTIDTLVIDSIVQSTNRPESLTPTVKEKSTPPPLRTKATITITFFPDASPSPACLGDLAFFTIAIVIYGTMLSFDAPSAIVNQKANPNSILDMRGIC